MDSQVVWSGVVPFLLFRNTFPSQFNHQQAATLTFPLALALEAVHTLVEMTDVRTLTQNYDGEHYIFL